jgi:hypothetical protein
LNISLKISLGFKALNIVGLVGIALIANLLLEAPWAYRGFIPLADGQG